MGYQMHIIFWLIMQIDLSKVLQSNQIEVKLGGELNV